MILDISNTTITGVTDGEEIEYNGGQPIEPRLTVTVNTRQLNMGTDYIVTPVEERPIPRYLMMRLP